MIIRMYTLLLSCSSDGSHSSVRPVHPLQNQRNQVGKILVVIVHFLVNDGDIRISPLMVLYCFGIVDIADHMTARNDYEFFTAAVKIFKRTVKILQIAVKARGYAIIGR